MYDTLIFLLFPLNIIFLSYRVRLCLCMYGRRLILLVHIHC